MECVIIGIAGGSGSGKSTFTNKLKALYGDRITVLYHDNYYRRHDELSLEERKHINYDDPAALETDLLVEHLKQLKEGKMKVIDIANACGFNNHSYFTRVFLRKYGMTPINYRKSETMS